jgi:hypothetical protein
MSNLVWNDTDAKEMTMYTNMEEEVFLSPESVISGVLAEHEVGGPEIDFEEDAVSSSWDEASAYA